MSTGLRMSVPDSMPSSPNQPACTTDVEIGGYFELALPNFGDQFPAPFLKYQSGRAALRAVLEASHFTRVLIPAYICDSVPQAVIEAGLKVDFYELDQQLLPASCARPLPRDVALLYVNYFGLCDDNLLRLQQEHPPAQLLIDNTQALFASGGTACGTIYAPHKFVGVPDGGLLVANGIEVSRPSGEDTGSMSRMNHLLIRTSGSARAGYADFLAAGNSLEDTRPLGMSRLTRRLLASVDLESVKQRRRSNFKRLSDALANRNRRSWNLTAHAVPLCYPLVLDHDVAPIRKRLADCGIYVPTYWEDARARLRRTSVEGALLDRCLALPCDQRYTDQQMDKLVQTLIYEMRSSASLGPRERGNIKQNVP